METSQKSLVSSNSSNTKVTGRKKISLVWMASIIGGLVLATLAVMYWPYVVLALQVINMIATFILMIGMGIALLIFGCGEALGENTESDEPIRDDPFSDFSMSLNGWD